MSKVIIKPEGPEELRTLVKGALENETLRKLYIATLYITRPNPNESDGEP